MHFCSKCGDLNTVKSFTCEFSIPFYFVNEAKDEIQMFSVCICIITVWNLRKTKDKIILLISY